LDAEPRTGYQVSLSVFGGQLAPTQRRFAVAETLSHLERLVASGRAARTEDGGTIAYTGSKSVDGEQPPSTHAPESGA